ncbi:KR domain-containing protein [Aspergillus navahoensis]
MFTCLHDSILCANGDCKAGATPDSPHSLADEPIGQAAVAIAQLVGANFYATVSDSAGMSLLTDEFGFAESQIFSNKSISFRKEHSWACMATFGTFIHLARANSESWTTRAGNNATVTLLNLDILIRDRPWIVGGVVEKIITMFKDGRLKPLCRVKHMTIGEIENAFRLIAKGQTTSKVVLDIQDGAVVKATVPRTPETRLSADATYVVAGGLGDIGQKICRLLASHGARHIVALSRSGKTRHAGDREDLEQQLEALGAKLYVLTCDITEETQVREVAEWCAANLPPVRGLVQSATVFQDRMLEGMDVELFNDTVRPKREGTLNLHNSFANECLDFFVMISSAATVFGIKGQAHYNSGNSFEEGFAMQNAMAGSRAHFTAIMPALISGSPADATGPQRKMILYRQGATTVEFDEVLALVEYAVGAQAPMDGYTQLVCGIAPDMIPNDGTYNLCYFLDILQPGGDKTTIEAGQAQEGASLGQKLAAAKGSEELRAVISEAITEKIRALIAVGLDDLGENVPLAEIGIDSLVAIEIKNWIGREFEVALQTAQVIDAPSIGALADSIRNGLTKLNQDNGGNNDNAAANSKTNKHAESTKGSLEVAVRQQKQPGALAKQNFECCSASNQLPVLPLLDLDSVLDLYLEAVKHLLEPEQLTRITELLTAFRKPEGLGRKLHARLQGRYMDPTVDNWLFQPYLVTIFTSRNYPVAPFSTFAGTDPLSDFPHGQAERATVVSLAVLKFKQQLFIFVFEWIF